MGIKNLIPRLAERGKIKIGEKGDEKTSKGGKTFAMPKKLDHFVITTMQRDGAGRFLPDLDLMLKYKPTLGTKITRLPVVLLYDDPELNFQTRYSCYAGNSLVCSGDGEQATRITREGTWESVQCPCPKLDSTNTDKVKCKPNGTLSVILKGAESIGGVWRFRTTSWNTVNAIMSSMALIQQITGGVLSGIPLYMALTPKTVTVPNTGQNMIVYVVNMEFDGSESELQKLGYEIQKRRIEHRINMENIEAKARRALIEYKETPEEQAEVAAEFYPENQGVEVAEVLEATEQPHQDPPPFTEPDEPESTESTDNVTGPPEATDPEMQDRQHCRTCQEPDCLDCTYYKGEQPPLEETALAPEDSEYIQDPEDEQSEPDTMPDPEPKKNGGPKSLF